MSFRISLTGLVAVFLSLNLVYADDRVRFEWMNASTLQVNRGYDIVQQDGPNFNMILCNFDQSDRRYVTCTNTLPVSSVSSQLNPFGISPASGGYYGIWLLSQRGLWEDKVFGQVNSKFDVNSIIRIDDHKLRSDNQFFMYLQPRSTDFPSVLMRLYLNCNNGTTYVGGELDLSSYITSGQRATYENSIYQLAQGCREACAEIYIQGLQRGTNFPHKFRAGSVCGSVMDGAVSVTANTIALATMLMALMFSAKFMTSS
uniref:Uncharacterized protein n=1 Tax=Plectus sambesii TaxID=2011161 RepID=A0A914UQ80_9BILA